MPVSSARVGVVGPEQVTEDASQGAVITPSVSFRLACKMWKSRHGLCGRGVDVVKCSVPIGESGAIARGPGFR